MERFRLLHKISGIYKKNTTVCENRQEGFRKFIEVKREKYDTSCVLGKISYVNQNKTHLLFAVNYSTASSNTLLLVHSRRRLQYKRQGRLLPSDLAVLCYVINEAASRALTAPR